MRARNLKPGFFKNSRLAKCQPLARLLFEGLWCYADHQGRLAYDPERIKAEILPYDAVEVEPLLEELIQYGFIRRYVVAGESYMDIPKFLHHQNPHKKEREKGSDIPTFGSESPRPGNSGASPGLDPEIPALARLNPESPFLNPDSGIQGNGDGAATVPECPYDLEALLLQEWGPKEGKMGYSVKVQMIQLGRQHGFDRLKYAIEQGAKFNKRFIAYVEGVLEKRGKKPGPSGSDHPYHYNGIHKPKAGAA